MTVPKYSLIIPTYNGVKYLPTCVNTILCQDYDNYELIISDDHSNDGTRDYLEQLKHPRLNILFPAKSMSMTEHWEWALSHAKGEWLIFIGQDDGLQSYFFKLADKLTRQAQSIGTRAIMSERAYFFWDGCQYVYGNTAINYRAQNKTIIHNTKYEAIKSLIGMQDYFEIPQMYTTSLFHKDLIKEAKEKQNQQVFSSHPQDANLACIATALEKRYLKSYIPLGWVGSSPKSAGMAMASDLSKANKSNIEDLNNLKNEYKKKVNSSKLEYHSLAGDFEIGNLAIYFWQSFLKTPVLHSKFINFLINAYFFKMLIFTDAYKKIKKFKLNDNQMPLFLDMLKRNKVSLLEIFLFIPFLFFIKSSINIFELPKKLKNKSLNLMQNTHYLHLRLWTENSTILLNDESLKIKNEISQRGWLK